MAIVLSPNVGTPNVDYPLPNGTQGVIYGQLVVASGGVTPYTFLVIGSLPPGLLAMQTADDTLTIAGTPNTPGTYSFDVQATDSVLATGHQQY